MSLFRRLGRRVFRALGVPGFAGTVSHTGPSGPRGALLAAATAVCTAIALLAGAAPASAAPLQLASGPGSVRPISPMTAAASGSSTTRRAGADIVVNGVNVRCDPGPNQFNRFEYCAANQVTWNFYTIDPNTGVTTLVGNAYFTLYQDIDGLTVTAPAQWFEFDTIADVRYVGDTGPLEITSWYASCLSACQVDAWHMPVNVPIYSGMTGLLPGPAGAGVAYHSIVTAGSQQGAPTYQMLFHSPGWASLGQLPPWTSPLKFRCDALLQGFFIPAGCVYPQFTPTFYISLSYRGASAALIKWAQTNLSAHWGCQACGGQPLRRLVDATQINSNRNIICQLAWKPYAPWVYQSFTDSDSCDEFPFASTYQSGAMPPNSVTTGASCAQLTAVRNPAPPSVATEAQIWPTVAPIGSYSPSAPCVRGHIPLGLNTGIGNDLQSFIGAERLLNDDPYWLSFIP